MYVCKYVCMHVCVRHLRPLCIYEKKLCVYRACHFYHRKRAQYFSTINNEQNISGYGASLIITANTVMCRSIQQGSWFSTSLLRCAKVSVNVCVRERGRETSTPLCEDTFTVILVIFCLAILHSVGALALGGGGGILIRGNQPSGFSLSCP